MKPLSRPLRSIFVAAIALSATLGVLISPVCSYAQATLITPSIFHSVADQGQINYELVRCVPNNKELGRCEGGCPVYGQKVPSCYAECRRRYACGLPL
jgi:hypothetical protein